MQRYNDEQACQRNRREKISCIKHACVLKKSSSTLFLDERFVAQSFVHIEFHRSRRGSISGEKIKRNESTFALRPTLILQEESSCRVQLLRGDKVEGDHARVRNDLDASRGTAIFEQRSSFFSHSHDVHAIAICFWSWNIITTFLLFNPFIIFPT